jgi:hypothetical protein
MPADDPNQARAHVLFDTMFGGIKVALLPNRHSVRQWSLNGERRQLTEMDGPEEHPADWLRLDEDEARALYESLTKYFGHDAVSTAALRADYLAERKRVDKMVDGLLSVATRPAQDPVVVVADPKAVSR